MNKFLQVQDDNKKQAVLLNTEHIVAIHQESTIEVTVSLVNGDKIKIAAQFDALRKRIETGSPFE